VDNGEMRDEPHFKARNSEVGGLIKTNSYLAGKFSVAISFGTKGNEDGFMGSVFYGLCDDTKLCYYCTVLRRIFAALYIDGVVLYLHKRGTCRMSLFLSYHVRFDERVFLPPCHIKFSPAF
jgi:hypothetical protein